MKSPVVIGKKGPSGLNGFEFVEINSVVTSATFAAVSRMTSHWFIGARNPIYGALSIEIMLLDRELLRSVDISSHPVLIVMAIAVTASLLAEIRFASVRVPVVVCEMVFGIVLGPQLLGLVTRSCTRR